VRGAEISELELGTDGGVTVKGLATIFEDGEVVGESYLASSLRKSVEARGPVALDSTIRLYNNGYYGASWIDKHGEGPNSPEHHGGDISHHLSDVERIARLNTPDWDDWCGNACHRVSEYLNEKGIPHRIEFAGGEDDATPDWPLGNHTFIRLPEGAVLDPTITQFADYPPVAEAIGNKKVGVFSPDHPLHQWYEHGPKWTGHEPLVSP